MRYDNKTLLPLIAATANGDRGAFTELYSTTSGKLFALSLQIVQRREWAEDVLQEAYIRIWHHAGEYHQDRGSVFNWMVSIVRYRCLDHLRRGDNRLRLIGDEAIEAMPEESSQPAPWESEDAALEKCIGQLSDDQRRSIMLAFYHGHTHDELAQRLSTPLGTIKSWIRRGLEALRKCLNYEL